jgi:uncharacterized protein
MLVAGYRVVISPILHWIGGTGCGCRFSPTCSHYMQEAVARHGVVSGLWMGLKRILRCLPLGGQGWDPVPPAARKIHASHYKNI